MRTLLILIAAIAVAAGCSRESNGNGGDAAPAAGAAGSSTPGLGIRPHGDETIKPDVSKVPDDVKKVFDYIDAHIDEDVVRFQKWIQQPSISNTGEGIQESAQMVKGFFEELGCQRSEVHDVGITEYGTPGNPVVYARCDEGAPRTLLIYWMYDTMPITQPDAWEVPPFEGRLVELPPYKKVLMGRGATNSKGPQIAQLNAFRAIKAVHGKLPVNLIVVAEGDEERMSIGLRKFVRDNPDLFKDAEAMYRFGGQGAGGGGEFSGGSEGCVYIELTTSGEKWGRGPTKSDIHGANKRSVDSPAWRHIKMLNALISEDGNRTNVPGFYDNAEPLSGEELGKLKRQAERIDLKVAAQNLGVGRFIADEPLEHLKMARYGISFNMDGIWGGNMYGGGAGAILPNKITSKHNMRYVPNMTGPDLVKKIRSFLDAKGFQDVELKLIGDVPWSKMRYDTDVAQALRTTYEIFGISYTEPAADESILGGYWPAYLFVNDGKINIPIVGGGAGHGSRAHAANEYYVIEGAGKVYGLAGAEKSVATVLYSFAGKVPPTRKETTN
jgi:acetylornithine deacetylase/succinyl-diaminopimelate desuccinylase-like protein